jgi:PAS domain S-box-containing protein
MTAQSRGFVPGDAPFLQGGGEMGARMRAFDWSATPLGDPATWPRSLKTAVRILLTSRQPMFVWWSERFLNLYNDPYIGVLGDKDRDALGRPAQEIWGEIWHDVGPRAESALREDKGTYDEALLLLMRRHGYVEETYFTFSYSPVPDDDGQSGGIFAACTDDTRRIIGERRVRVLRELSSTGADARTVADACARCTTALVGSGHDVPFALLYLLDADGCASLASASGITPGGVAVPSRLGTLEAEPWPVLAVARDGSMRVDTLAEPLRAQLPPGVWQHAPYEAAIVPIARAGEAGPSGVLVAGLNPFRPFDDDYRGFLELAAAQVTATIAGANAYEEERRRAETLAELDRAKTLFFSNVSHEFRTPLTLMLGPLDELCASAQGPAREQLDLLQRNARRLHKLVNTLLDFSRIEAGRIRARFAPSDLATLTTDLASTFRSACERAGLALVVDCAPLAEPVWVDREMWEKIVLNLLSNAFKFTFAGEITVRLEERAGSVLLHVADTGVGIAADDLPHVFERFRRVEGAVARTHEGTGIGLALVQELVALHGGQVTVTSQPARGTTFTVTLPRGHAHLPREQIVTCDDATRVPELTEAFVGEALRWLPDDELDDRSDADAPPSGVSSAARSTPPGASDHVTPRARIVLADDNADMRAYLRRLLRPRYDVEAMPDGAAALAAIRREPPDLVLSDVMMPHLDGVGLLAALRADDTTRGIPVVLLSARAGEQAQIEGLEQGADDYLVKPFSAGELLARVEARLELARARRRIDAALRDSAARFREMADAAPVMMWVAAADGSCTYRGRSWYEFTGQIQDTGLGMGWLDPIHPDDVEAVRRAYLEATERRAAFRQEYRLRQAGGAWRWVLDAAIPQLGRDGRARGFIGSVIDISDRKIVEDALRDADRRKDEFLATLAHELRNPLAPMRNALHALRIADNDDSPANPAHLHAMMERQVNHMVRLVDDLLEVSRITRGKIELRLEPIDLAAVIRAAVETSRPLIDAGGHELQVDLPDTPVTLNGDPVRLAQVIGNLLNNAAKYTPRGGHIGLAVQRRGGEVELEVRDDGVGIPSDMLGQVFELFTQVDHTRAAAQGGLGIGLTLVQRIVELHGGRVEASSAGPNRGSTFVVRLPIPDTTHATAAPDGDDARTTLPSRRVLVVDDNLDAAESLGVLLQFLGANVKVVNDGPEALAVLDAFRPELVLLDIGMPGMDGYEVAARIRALPDQRGVTLIALTGWGQSEDRERSHAAGFDRHLVKPIDIDTLEALLQD